MCNDHTFRSAGRTRGENGVNGVGINLTSQISLCVGIGLRLVFQHLLHNKDLFVEHPFHLLFMNLVCDDGFRLQYVQDRTDSRIWRLGIEGHIEVTTHVDAGKSLNHGASLGDINPDGRPPQTFCLDGIGYHKGRIEKFCKGNAACCILNCCLLRMLSSSVNQIFNDTFLHTCSVHFYFRLQKYNIFAEWPIFSLTFA